MSVTGSPALSLYVWGGVWAQPQLYLGWGLWAGTGATAAAPRLGAESRQEKTPWRLPACGRACQTEPWRW